MLMSVRKMVAHLKMMNNILLKLGALICGLLAVGLIYAYLILVPEYVPSQMFDINALNNFILSAIILFLLMLIGFILKIIGKR